MRFATSTRRPAAALLALVMTSTLLGYPQGRVRAQEGGVGPASGPFVGTLEDPCEILRGPAVDLVPHLMPRGDAAGLWFPMPMARLVLCEVRELRIRRDEIEVMNRAQETWRLAVRLLEEQVGLAVAARVELGDVVAAAERRAREAERRASVWWRRPPVWFTAGLVVASILVVGGALIFR